MLATYDSFGGSAFGAPSPYVGEDPVLVARRLAGLNPDGSQPATLATAQLNKNLAALDPVEINRIALLSKPVTVSPQLAALSSVASAPAPLVVSSAPLSGPVSSMTPAIAALPTAQTSPLPVPFSSSSGLSSVLNTLLRPRLSSVGASSPELAPVQGAKSAATGVGAPRSSIFPSWLVTTATRTPASAAPSSALELKPVPLGTEVGPPWALLALAAVGLYIAFK